jgi:kynurenine 3-monooxygenase
MRDKVADPKFLLQKKIEANFSAKHPDKWTPAYSLVTFRPDVRYSEALCKGNLQQDIMNEVMGLDNIESAWDTEIVEKLMLDKIQQKQHV